MQRFNMSATLLYKAHRDITPALILVHFWQRHLRGEDSGFSSVKILSYVCYSDITSDHTR
jgi:hypothetical protein